MGWRWLQATCPFLVSGDTDYREKTSDRHRVSDGFASPNRLGSSQDPEQGHTGTH